MFDIRQQMSRSCWAAHSRPHTPISSDLNDCIHLLSINTSLHAVARVSQRTAPLIDWLFFRLQRRWTLAHNHTLSSGRCAANPFLSRPSSVCRLLAVGILVYMLAARRVDGGRNEARSSHVSPNCVTCFPLRRRWMSYLSCCSGSRIYFPSLRSRRRRRTTWAGRRTWIARPWKPGRPVVMLTEPLSSSWTRHTGWGGAEAAAEGRGWRECHTVGRRHPATLIYSETLRFETQNQASTFQTAVLCSAQLQWHGQDIRERGFQNKNVDWNNTSGFHLKKKWVMENNTEN